MSEQVGSNEESKTPARQLFGGHRFPKGVSGNPSGRRKNDFNLVDLAKSHTKEAIETLVRVMRTAPRHADQAGAAIALLDRGWGRPAQMLLGDPNRPVSIDFRWADDTPVVPPSAQPQQLIARVIDAVAFDDATSAPGSEDKP